MKNGVVHFFAMVALLLFSQNAQAYFWDNTPSGHQLCYNFLYNNYGQIEGVCVIPPDSMWYSYDISGHLIIPSTVTHNSITYPVVAIDYSCFRGDTGLTALTIPSTVTTIYGGAFYNCTNLTNINVNCTTPPTITSYTFENVPNNVTVTVPCGSATLYSNTDYWNSFINIHEDCGTTNVSDTISIYNSNGLLFYYKLYGSSATLIGNVSYRNYPHCSLLQIPSQITNPMTGNNYTVTAIADHAFENCTWIDSMVTFPNTLTRIGAYAFNGTNLHYIILPTSLVSIGDYAFSGLKLYHRWPLIWNENDNYQLDSIGERAFYMCQAFNCQTCPEGSEYLFIPQNVSYVGQYAFAYFQGLDSVLIGSRSGYGQLSTICAGMFEGCKDLWQVRIPNHIRSIESCAFQNCRMLNNIGWAEFSGFDLRLPDSLQTVGHQAFWGCNNLGKLYLIGVGNPPQYPYSWPYYNAELVVPCGTSAIYRSQYGENQKITEDCEYTISVFPSNDSLGTVMGNGTYHGGTTAILTAIPVVGRTFVGWSDSIIVNPRPVYISDSVLNMNLVAVFGYGELSSAIEYLFDTIITHDTINIDHWVHDTSYIDRWHYDTIVVYDSVTVEHWYFDTILVDRWFHDTLYLPVYYYDTIFQIAHDTIYLPQYIHDTIYIHDTVYITEEGIDGVDALNAKLYSRQGQIVVEGADGNNVTLYDVSGRVLATKHDEYTPLRFDVPASGTYMIKIGLYPARKVVVIR